MASVHCCTQTPTTSLITLAGMTCSGKTSLAAKLTATHYFSRVVTATTRPPRQLKTRREAHGVDYLFLSEKEFLLLEQSNGLLETTTFAHHRYGTPRLHIDQIQSRGRIPLVITDPEGALRLKQLGRHEGWDVLNVFLACDIKTALARLKNRELRDQDNNADYYIERTEALTCDESAWTSRYPWDLTLQQFTEENFDWQLSLLLNSCRDGSVVAGKQALSHIAQ